MDILIEYCSLFFLGGFGGWIIEIFFRRFVSQKRWVNPGFLTGPIVPLYGFGLSCFYFFCQVIPWQSISDYSWLNYTIEILSAGVAMTLLEYIAGIIFIKGMKIKLWDYSNRWGNIQGIICPLFSLIWLVAGVAYVFLCHPFFVSYTSAIVASKEYVLLPIGICIGMLIVDFAYSVHLATKIRKSLEDSKLVASWEKVKVSFQDHMKKTGAWNFVLAFQTKKEDFDAMMKEYASKQKEELARRRAEIEEKKAKKAQQKANKNNQGEDK